MIKKLLIIVILFICACTTSYAQRDSAHQWLVRANVQHGVLLPEYGFIGNISNDYIRGFEINFCKSTIGENQWQQLYRFPSFGLSFYYCTLGNKEHFGEEFTLYPYYALNIARGRKWSLNYQMGIGVSYATKKYDQDNNYQNLAIGSHFNIHYHADIIAQWKVLNRMYLNGGISFSHISNANLSEPNVGLNSATAFVGMAWGIGQRKAFVNNTIPAFNPFFTYEILVNGGMKHTRTFESFQYLAFSVSFDAKRRTRYKFALGVGMDFFYDASTEPQMIRLNKPYKSSDSFTSGIHFAEEFVYDKLSLILQVGIYIGLTEKLNGYVMYNRAIARYKFSKHFFANFSLKTHLYILDFPEVGIGYYW